MQLSTATDAHTTLDTGSADDRKDELTEKSLRPVPVADPDTRPYWEAARQGSLKLPRCRACRRYCFPPRRRCPRCLSTDMDWTELSGRGAVFSFCVVHQAAIAGFEPPYVVAEVEVEEQTGLRLISNVVDCDREDVYIGLLVEATFEHPAEDEALPQFRPRPA